MKQRKTGEGSRPSSRLVRIAAHIAGLGEFGRLVGRDQVSKVARGERLWSVHVVWLLALIYPHPGAKGLTLFGVIHSDSLDLGGNP